MCLCVCVCPCVCLCASISSYQKLDLSVGLLLSGSCDSPVPASMDISSHTVEEISRFLLFLERRT